MPSDYIPDSFENRYNWLVNLKQQVTDNAADLKLTAAQTTAFNSLVDPLIAAYKALLDAQAALDQASGDAQDLFGSSAAGLRAFINQLKANPLFTDGMGAAMQVFTTGGTPQPADIKPTLKAVPERGHVRLTGSKNYAETVNIYLRRKTGPASGQWVLIAPKRKCFPFDDQTPLATPGTPEEREYMARGVIADDEIGQDSDIVGCTYGG